MIDTIPDHWAILELGDLGEFRNGANFGRACYGPGYSIINVTDLYRGRYVPTHKLAEIDPAKMEPNSDLFVKQGDILFARSSVKASGAGQAAMVQEPRRSTIFSGFVIRFRLAATDHAVPLYLNYLLRSPFYREMLPRIASGTTITNLSQATLARLEVPLPPMCEQHAIADVLGRLDDKIELNRRMNRTLEQMAAAIFKAWFVDFEPIRVKADAVKGFRSMPQEVFEALPGGFSDSELGSVPVGWRVRPLGDCLSVIETGKRPRGGVTGIHSGVPSVGAESVVGIGLFDFSKTKFVPPSYYSGMKRGRVMSHDVLLYKDGGRPGEFEPHITMVGDGFPFDEFCINEHVYRLRTNELLRQTYLYWWLSSDGAMHEMRQRGTGVAIPGLNSTQAKSIRTLVPPDVVVEAFDGLASPLVSQIFRNCNESRTLAAIRDTLLPKLLSGEIRVGEAARIAEDVA